MAANFSCGIAPVTSVGPACSGNGECVFNPTLNRGVCVCSSGWQGESDFQVTNSFLDCQINILAIRILWAISLCVMLLMFALMLPKLRWLWQKHETIVQRNKQIGKTYRLWDNKGLFALLPFVVIGLPCMSVMAIIKIANQDLKIGDSVIVTILYIVFRTTFGFAPDNFQPALLASLLRSERNLDHIIAVNRSLARAHLGLFWSVSILTIIPMVVPQDTFTPNVGMISFAVFANFASLAMLFLALQGRFIENKVQAILINSYAVSRDERTKKIMEKIAVNQKEVVKGGMVQCIIYGTFGVLPFMWNKHDYLVPFSFAACALQIRTALASLVQEEGEKTSSTKPHSPNLSDNRKQMVVRDDKDSAVDSSKDMYVHGLDLDPMANLSTIASTAQSSEGEKQEQSSSVRVNISPAMRVLRAFTPSRKPAGAFNFEESGIGETNQDDKNA